MDAPRERLDRRLPVRERRRADEHCVGRLALEQLVPVRIGRAAPGELAGAGLVEVADGDDLDSVEARQRRHVLRRNPSRSDHSDSHDVTLLG